MEKGLTGRERSDGRSEPGRTPSASAVRRLAISRATSFAGSNAAFIALSSILYVETGSATWVAAAAFASIAVPAFVSPFAGFLGDRYDRRRVMIASELCGAACFAAMVIVSAPAALLFLRVVASLVAAPFVPATTAALPSLVDREDELPRANAALVSASWAGALVGPLIAGLLLAAVDGQVVFAVNVATFLASAAVLLSVRGDFRPARRTTSRSPAEFVTGFKTLNRHPVLRPVTIAYGIMSLGIGVAVPAEVAISEAFGAGPLGYAALFCLWALGGVVGARFGRPAVVRYRWAMLFMVAAVGLAFGIFLVAISPSFGIALLGMVTGGAFQGLWMTAQELLIQKSVPDERRSRAVASSEAVGFGGIGIGLLAAGLAVSTAGPRGAFGVAAASCLVGAAILLLALRRAGTEKPSSKHPKTRRGRSSEWRSTRHPSPAPVSLQSGSGEDREVAEPAPAVAGARAR
jgi:MFS family permease